MADQKRLPVTDTAENERPWKELRMASTWLERRKVVARSSAVSLASVPLVVKKTRASGIGTRAAIRSASSICWGIRYRVEVWSIRSAWRRMASTTGGTR